MKIIKQFCLSFILFLGVLFWFCLPPALFNDTPADILLAADSTLLGARIAPDGQWRFPEIIAAPEKVEKAILSFEDKRFYQHPGIDPLAVIRAISSNLKAQRIVSGGSTITMQLIRIARKNQSRTIAQKFLEAILALRVEIAYSKEQILALYLSHAPFGGNTVGVEAAAWRYFNRSASNLSWAEAAMLAVLPNAPALIHPGRNREALRKKRDALLYKLYQQGEIDELNYTLAIDEPIPSRPANLPNLAPHLLQRLCRQGKRGPIHTTIDAQLQRQIQDLVNRYALRYQSNYIHNMAVLVADIQTGRVLAYIGNPTIVANQAQGMQVDMVLAERSTGSLLKPLLYAGMIDAGELLPTSLVADVPLYVNGFVPSNFNRQFHGAVPADMAVSRSLNVPLVRMLMRFGHNRFYHLLKNCGMNTLHKNASHYGLSLVLGGAEGTLWNMTSMYASLAQVLLSDSDAPFITTPFSLQPPVRQPVYAASPISRSALWYAFEAMSRVNRPEEESDWQIFHSMKKIAWKTGTSYGARDAWAIGLNARHIVGVWVGNASGEGRAGLTGVTHAAPVLFDAFSFLPASGWFEKPVDEMAELPVCAQSGFKAGVYCDQTDTLLLPAVAKQSSICPYHKSITMDQTATYRVNADCYPLYKIKKQNWFVLPPAQEFYYRRYNPSYQPLPPMAAGCLETENKIDLIYPTHNMRIFLPVGFSGNREHFVFKAAHNRPQATLFWHINDTFYGQTTGNHELAVSLDPGKYLLTLLDETGQARKINFFIVRKSKK